MADAARSFGRHRCESLGAALAFKTLLALAPLLVVAVAVLGFVVGDGEAGTAAARAARQAFGPHASEVVSQWLRSARSFGTAATAIGVVFLLWGASRLVAQLVVALRVVFEAEDGHPDRPVGHAVLRTALSRLAAIGWTLLLGLWIAASILSRKALMYVLPHHAVLRAGRTLLSIASLTIAVAVAYKMFPVRALPWRRALQGAAITASLVTLGSWLLELWFTRVNVGVGYGASGGLVVFLLWLYVASQIFLFGAEVSAAVLRRGADAEASRPTDDPVDAAGRALDRAAGPRRQ